MADDLRRNLEIKARCTDLTAARRRLLEGGAIPHGSLDQIDTYFHVPHGRLKLRQIRGRGAQLIGYDRADQAGPRQSEFQLLEIGTPDALLGLLARALGIRVEVRKHREVLLWTNVRIHLDQVEGLGTFIELEAVISNDDDQRESPGRLEHLCKIIRIAEDELVAGSYSDLLGASR